VDLVYDFVRANVQNPDWKMREAAVLAYGSIMEGPTSTKMEPLVSQSWNLVQALNDQSVAVRDTMAWTLGRIAQFHAKIVPVKELTPILGEKLQDVPRVSANVCWVIQVLAENMAAFSGAAVPETTPFSPFFPDLAKALLQVATRPDADERQLRMSAYNALSILCSHAGNDCLSHMAALLQEMLNHLDQSFRNVERECELQGFICGVITALVQRLRAQVLPLADRVMQDALRVMSAYQQVRGGAPSLQEEALLVVAALANAVGGNFERFMPHFAPQLKIGLENYEDVQVCLMATGVIGDLCRALEGKIITYTDTILQILHQNLQNPSVDRKIKAAIMPCFGDIALAITGEFEKYLAFVVQMLLEASRTKLDDGPRNNEEWVDYLNTLREGVLEAYTGVIHGLRDAGKLHLFKEHVNAVLHFVQLISEDSSVSESVMKAAVGVIGDLVLAFQQELAQHLGNAPFLARLVEFASRSTDPNILQTGSWLRSLLQKYGSVPSQ